MLVLLNIIKKDMKLNQSDIEEPMIKKKKYAEAAHINLFLIKIRPSK